MFNFAKKAIENLHYAMDDAKMMKFMRLNQSDLYNELRLCFFDCKDPKIEFDHVAWKLDAEDLIFQIVHDHVELRTADEVASNKTLSDAETIQRKYNMIQAIFDRTMTRDDFYDLFIDPVPDSPVYPDDAKDEAASEEAPAEETAVAE